MNHRHKAVSYTPAGYVKAANLIAAIASQDAPLRALAAHIVGPQGAAPVGRYPLILAEWVRKNIRYAQEQGEVIQGPNHTLPHIQIGPWTIGGAGVGDCDDLVTTWAALCRALGVQAWLVGVGPSDRNLQHAVGFAGGEWYELTDCPDYGCPRTRSMGIAFPRSWRAICYCPDSRRWITLTDYVARAPSATMGNLSDAAGVLSSIQAAGTQVSDAIGPVGLRRAVNAGLQAAGTAGSAASTAASLAASLGASSAAVPVIGWAVAGAALIGVGIGALIKAGKVKRRTLRSGLAVEDWINAVVTLSGAQTADDRTWIKVRLWELIPKMAGTGVPLATYDGKRLASDRVFRWVDGRSGSRKGVQQARRSKKAEGEVLQQHVASLETFAGNLASLPLDQRQGAIRLALSQFLGAEALAGRVGELLPEYIAPETPDQVDGGGQGGQGKGRSAALWLIPIAAAAAAFAFA